MNIVARLIIWPNIRFRQAVHAARWFLHHDLILLIWLHTNLSRCELSILYRMRGHVTIGIHHFQLILLERFSIFVIQHNYGLFAHHRSFGIRVTNSVLTFRLPCSAIHSPQGETRETCQNQCQYHHDSDNHLAPAFPFCLMRWNQRIIRHNRVISRRACGIIRSSRRIVRHGNGSVYRVLQQRRVLIRPRRSNSGFSAACYAEFLPRFNRLTAFAMHISILSVPFITPYGGRPLQTSPHLDSRCLYAYFVSEYFVWKSVPFCALLPSMDEPYWKLPSSIGLVLISRPSFVT